MKSKDLETVRPISGAAERKRVVYTENRFRHYSTRIYAGMSQAVQLVALWINPWPSNEPPPESLSRSIEWQVVSSNPKTLQPWHLLRTIRYMAMLWRLSSGAHLIISGTSDSWKSTVAFVVARLRGVPIGLRKEQWIDHNMSLSPPRRLYWGVVSAMRRGIERRADVMLACGANSHQYLISNGITRKRIFDFPFNPPDMQEMPIEEPTLAYLRMLKGDSVALLYLGRIIPKKGLLQLILTVQRLRNEGLPCVLFVVGAPLEEDTGRGAVSLGYYGECEREAAKTGGGVHFFGDVDNRSVCTYYRASDIFVHPHVGKLDGNDTSEGYGCVVIEAASMSLPIVVSDRVGSGKDLVHNSENGFIVDASHLGEELYERLAWLITNRAQLEEMGRRSRAYYEARFGPLENQRVLEAVLQALDGVFESNGNIPLARTQRATTTGTLE